MSTVNDVSMEHAEVCKRIVGKTVDFFCACQYLYILEMVVEYVHKSMGCWAPCRGVK